MLQEEGSLVIRGIYLAAPPLFQQPMIMTLIEKQIAYALLDGPLPYESGDYVEVHGETRVNSDLKELRLKTEPNKIKRIADYAALFKQAQGDYRRLLYAAETTAADCPQKLPPFPQFLAFLDEEHGSFVAFFSAADLLYSAQIDLVYDVLSKKLDRVYINCHFKGE
ncbi:MAG: hypothetical protein ONB12_01920 [candidate division KSB1 bacterium]|nr:hypothetical protein [candidate division KSB1 bacterium]